MSDSSGGWFLTHGEGEVHGPFTLAALVEAARQGNISPTTQVRHEAHTSGQWLVASRIRPVAESLAARPEPAGARPEPTTARPGPTTARPEPTTARSESATARSESASVQPESAGARPAPQTAPTASVTAPQSPAAAAPSTTASKPISDVSVDVQGLQKLGRGKHSMVVPETFGSALIALFDFRFRYYITPWIIKITWAVCVVLALVAFLFFTVGFLIQPLVHSADVHTNVQTEIPEGMEIGDQRPRGNWQFQPPDFLAENTGRVVAYLSTALFFGFILLYLRMVLETAIVLFRIAIDLGELKDSVKDQEEQTGK